MTKTIKLRAFAPSRLFLIYCLSCFALSACDNAKEQLGVAKKAPDEFAVVKRAPLSMPPDYSLRPPRPGAPRPQEQETAEQAAATLFGSGENPAPASASHTEGESALLAQAGAKNADARIRQKIDAETIELAKKNVPVAKKILGLGDDPGAAPSSVVNASAEAERLKRNKEQGKPVTAGETPAVER